MGSSNGNTRAAEVDRQILETIVKTKVVDFEALGKMVTAVGPASAALDDDGWIRFCGSDMRIYKWPRSNINLEEIEALAHLSRNLTHNGAGLGNGVNVGGGAAIGR
jgi:hypothetical protein